RRKFLPDFFVHRFGARKLVERRPQFLPPRRIGLLTPGKPDDAECRRHLLFLVQMIERRDELARRQVAAGPEDDDRTRFKISPFGVADASLADGIFNHKQTGWPIARWNSTGLRLEKFLASMKNFAGSHLGRHLRQSPRIYLFDSAGLETAATRDRRRPTIFLASTIIFPQDFAASNESEDHRHPEESRRRSPGQNRPGRPRTDGLPRH